MADLTSILLGNDKSNGVLNKKEQSQVMDGLAVAGQAGFEALGITKKDLQPVDQEEVKPDADAQDFGDVSSDEEDDDLKEEEDDEKLHVAPIVNKNIVNQKDQHQKKSIDKIREELFPQHTILAKPRREQDGPILRFTELFGSKKFFGIKRHLQQLKNKKKIQVKFNPNGYESDEEHVFEQYPTSVKAQNGPYPLSQLEKVAELVDDDEAAIKKQKDQEAQEETSEQLSELDKLIIQRTSLSLVDQIEWENAIIWEETGDDQQEHQQARVRSLHHADGENQEEQEVYSPTPNRVAYGMFEDDFRKKLAESADRRAAAAAAAGSSAHVSSSSSSLSIAAVGDQAASVRGYTINHTTPNKMVIAPVNKDLSNLAPPVREITSSTMKILGSPSLSTPTPPVAGNPAVSQHAAAGSMQHPHIASSSAVLPPEPADINDASINPEEAKKRARKRYYRKKKDKENADNLISSEVSKEIEHDQLISDDIDTIQTSTNQKFKRGLNEGLLQGDWEEMIIWDDEQGPKKQPLVDLVFDMNDENLVFVNEAAQNAKAQKKKKQPPPKQQAELGLDLLDQQQVSGNTISRYNVSMDAEYEEFAALLGPQRKEGKHIVRHSTPALQLEREYFRTYIPREELRHLHRPFHCFGKGTKIPVAFKVPKPAKKGKRKQKIAEKKPELSVCDHRFLLMEHVEHMPPMLNNVGMGNYIVNYYKKKLDDNKIPTCEDGVTKVIESQDMLPLLGMLKEGEFLSALENSMFSAQIFPYKKYKEQPFTDFVLIMKKSESGTHFYIREVPTCYTVGHTQPHNEVPAPNSTPARIFLQSRLAWFIHRTFKNQLDRGEVVAKIRIDDIVEAFPNESHTTVRRCLRECATYQRGGDGNGTWIAKQDKIPSEEELQALITPEMTCANESMLAGELRHLDCGLSENTCIAAFASSFAKVSQKDKEVIKFISRERMRAPWNKTANFLDFLNKKEGSKLHLLEVASQNFTGDELARLSITAEKAIAESAAEAEAAGNEGESSAPQDEAAKKNTPIPDEKKKKSIKNTQVREILRYVFSKEAERLSKGISYFDHLDSSSSAIDALEKDVNANMDEDDEDAFNEFEREFENFAQEQDDFDDDEFSNRMESERVLDMFGDGESNNFKMDGGVGSDNDENASVSSDKGSSLVTSATSKRGKKNEKQKRYIVRKTVTVTLPDGTKTKKVEIIRDPALVKFYKTKKENWDSAKSKKKHKSIPFFGGDPADYFQVGPQDRRRLQDNFRRFKQLLEQQRTGNVKSRSALIGANDTIVAKKRKEREKKSKKKKKDGGDSSSANASGESSSSGIKLKVSKNIVDMAKSLPAAKSGTKRKKLGDESPGSGDEYQDPTPQGKRRRLTTGQKVSEILKVVLYRLKAEACAQPFLVPVEFVDPQQMKEYRKIIAKPIDISAIERKITNLVYMDHNAFLADIELMVQNAITYCTGRYSLIPPQGEELLAKAREEIKNVETKIEEALKEPATAPKIVKKSKKKKGADDGDVATPVSSTTVDGEAPANE